MSGHVKPVPIATYPAAGTEVEFAFVTTPSITDWKELPGVESYASAGGEAEPIGGTTFKSAWAASGIPGPAAIAFSAQHNPLHPVWDMLRTAKNERALTHCRVTLRGRHLWNNPQNVDLTDSIAISTLGIVTFTGEEPDFTSGLFGEGTVILLSNGNPYVISEINDAGRVTVIRTETTPAAIPAQTGYNIYLRSVYREMVGTIIATDTDAITTEGTLVCGLTMQLQGQLPKWKQAA